MKLTRLILPVAFACVIGGLYCGWRWGIPALMQTSGSRAATEGRDWPRERQMRVSEERARSIKDAVIAYRTAKGQLPASLDLLVPAFLPSLPEPATTTMPFEFIIEPGGNFRICWEPWPNTTYERYWIDQDGKRAGDT